MVTYDFVHFFVHQYQHVVNEITSGLSHEFYSVRPSNLVDIKIKKKSNYEFTRKLIPWKLFIIYMATFNIFMIQCFTV